jgi:hypothetical protein
MAWVVSFSRARMGTQDCQSVCMIPLARQGTTVIVPAIPAS